MGTVIHGQYLIIRAGTKAIAGAKECTVQTSAETIEVSSSTLSEWKNYIYGRKSWTVSVSTLTLHEGAFGTTGGSGVTDLLNVGNTFAISFYDTRYPNRMLTGNALLETAEISASKGNLAKGVFKFKGAGELSAS